MINKDISKPWNLNFQKRSIKSVGRTSPLVNDTVRVERFDGKTVCKISSQMTDHYQSSGGACYYGMSKNYASETRQRMRPWLESRINSGDIRGLEWLSKDHKVFKVPWKHVGNREWSEHDGIIFREWAEHTGKYREGVDQADWPTWKTRFRCALTKLPDITELKEYNQLDGQMEEPYRVYRFVAKSNGDVSLFSHVINTQIIDDSENNSPANENECTEPVIPTTVNYHQSEDTVMLLSERLPSDIRDMEAEDLMKIDSDEIRQVQNEEMSEPMEMPDIQVDPQTDENINQIARKNIPFQKIQSLIMPPNSWTLDPNDCKLYITIKYLLVSMFEKLCTNTSGCHIFYDKQIMLQTSEEYEQMFGPQDADQIGLPPCNIGNTQQKRLTYELLNATDRGLVVRVENGNIYATRKCRCRMYVSKPSLENNHEIIKLQRDEETLVFDLHGYFKHALDKYVHQRGPKPSVEVIVGFGQHFNMERESINNLLVSATIVHTEAHNLLTRIACTSPLSPGLSMSTSNPMDRIVDVLSQFSNL